MDIEIASSVCDTTGDAMSCTTVGENDSRESDFPTEQLSLHADEDVSISISTRNMAKLSGLEDIDQVNAVERCRLKVKNLAAIRDTDLETISGVVSEGIRNMRVRESSKALRAPLYPPPRDGVLTFTKAMVAADLSPEHFNEVDSDEEALATLEKSWVEFKALSLSKMKPRFKGMKNLVAKFRYQNLSLVRDIALLEGFCHRLLTEDFELVNQLEEAMAKNRHYEELLRKNGIKVPSLEVTANKSARSVKDNAFLSYIDK